METNHHGEKDPLRHIRGVGYDEPRKALEKYHTAFDELKMQWSKQTCPEVTPRILEAYNAYNTLRCSLGKEACLPDKLTKETAKYKILGDVFTRDLGL